MVTFQENPNPTENLSATEYIRKRNYVNFQPKNSATYEFYYPAKVPGAQYFI